MEDNPHFFWNDTLNRLTVNEASIQTGVSTPIIFSNVNLAGTYTFLKVGSGTANTNTGIMVHPKGTAPSLDGYISSWVDINHHDPNGSASISGLRLSAGSAVHTIQSIAVAAGTARPIHFIVGDATSGNRSGIMYVNKSWALGDLVSTDDQSTKAVLTLSSTTKAFLPPRLTTVQKNAIVAPVEGSVVYDSTLQKLCVVGATGWETVTSV